MSPILKDQFLFVILILELVLIFREYRSLLSLFIY